MEQVKRDTPSKIQGRDGPLISGSVGTPLKQKETTRYATYQNGACRFTVLPGYISSPSGLKKRKNFIIKNPFEPDLSKLQQSMISPTVFAKNPGTSEPSPGFTWSIDELARTRPVEIEEFPVQQISSPDPEIEIKAQAAIDQFFQQNQIVLSPWDITETQTKSCILMDTPNRPLELNSTKELKTKKDSWSQTVLSLPPTLPQDVEQVLTPYFTFTQEQNTDNDDDNLTNNSLRRKLFAFQECDDDNSTTSSSSPAKISESMLYHDPPQSAMFVHGTSLKRLPQGRRRSSESSSIVKTENLSSPDISPIHNSENNMLYKKEEQCLRSATRLDFAMDISIDNISMEKTSTSINDYQSIDNQDSHKLIILNNDEMNFCDSINMKTSSKYANSADNTVHSYVMIFNDKDHCDNGTGSNIITEIDNSIHGNYKQNNMMSEASGQQNISSSIQDAGYQTCSMSNTMHTVENYSNISVSHRINCNDQIINIKDNAQLSWRENTRNIFSSTPSKCNKQDES